MTKISIIGLGWIGLPLAQLLAKNHTVYGSTTSKEKADQLHGLGINVFQFSLEPFPKGLGFQQLFNSEVLVINIPPKSRSKSGEYYLEQMKFLKSMVVHSAIKKVIFVSSTGIYPAEPRPAPYTEDEVFTKEISGNQTIYQSEQMLSQDRDYELTIVRFGGLLGDDRIPGKYSAAKENVLGSSRVNYIYREDAVRMLQWIIGHDCWNTTYNGVAALHPTRKEVIEKNVIDLGIAPPKSYSLEGNSNDRLISGEKILATGFQFKYPDPLHFPYSKTIV